MYNGNTVGVVVPAYNERGFVGEVIDTLPEFVDRAYVVDDQSTDGTWQEIQEHAEAANRAAAEPEGEPRLADGGVGFTRKVVPIRHETNRGVGGAIKTGYRRAYADGMDVTAVMAGDGQMDPDSLPRLLDPIVDGDADYAKSTRLLDAEYREEMPPFRLFGNRLLSVLTKIASGYWQTTDPQNGYTAISREALADLDIDSLYDDYGFANELLVRLNCHGMTVADVAVPAVYGDEESTIRYRSFVPKLSWLLLTNFLHRQRAQFAESGARATPLCYALGLSGILAAVAAGLIGDADLLAALVVGSYLSLGFAIHRDRQGDEGLEMRVTDDE
ncbi:glycosyltransferase family 2 protein [Halorussus sp. MSC15.2]|uniref:glycosyltransferase family 2 protein n=1 Tax=Halorussus sp. MSC15.2 TaxID=2283638 RepID=UPI0013D4AA2F|nr:glycosyltransferase family 2 protein [Halorussus sp. MSC15.2]NEU56644.1 glycosyltransferase family 2 protein [Halorussus sp. MSC15.2]